MQRTNRILPIHTAIIMLFFFSCSYENSMQIEETKNHHIKRNNLHELNGQYLVKKYSDIISKFQIDTSLLTLEEGSIVLDVISKNLINLTLYSKNREIANVNLEGRYKFGYFKLKKGKRASMIYGPLLWVGGESSEYIGLTKNKNLLHKDNGSGGILVALILPISVSAPGPTQNEYERIK